MVTFAVVNVISAIFLKQTLAAAAGDSEVAVMERLAKKEKDVARLREIFREGDKDGSGSVDWQEFQTMIQNPRVRAWLGILELDITDMATVFNLLDDGDGHVQFDEFISGVMKCRGAARGVEVVNLLSEYRQILQQLDEMKHNLQDLLHGGVPAQTAWQQGGGRLPLEEGEEVVMDADDRPFPLALRCGYAGLDRKVPPLTSPMMRA